MLAQVSKAPMIDRVETILTLYGDDGLRVLPLRPCKEDLELCLQSLVCLFILLSLLGLFVCLFSVRLFMFVHTQSQTAFQIVREIVSVQYDRVSHGFWQRRRRGFIIGCGLTIISSDNANGLASLLPKQNLCSRKYLAVFF